NQRIFYTTASPRPIDRNLYVTDFSGKKPVALTSDMAWHRVQFNKDFSQYYDFKSDINTPQVVTLNELVVDKKKSISNHLVKTVNESAKLKEKINEYGYGKAEFIRIPNSKGDTLNGW